MGLACNERDTDMQKQSTCRLGLRWHLNVTTVQLVVKHTRHKKTPPKRGFSKC